MYLFVLNTEVGPTMKKQSGVMVILHLTMTSTRSNHVLLLSFNRKVTSQLASKS